MREATTIEEVRAAVGEAHRAGKGVGFVPTMGALHEGHLSLVKIARRRSEYVVLSVFVNPTQFGPQEDFEAYPRDLEGDREQAAAAGVDLFFAPRAQVIYPPGPRARVRVEGLSDPLCGRFRPGHFEGVALVVAKLLNIVQPDFSVFGQKDAQQAILIHRLVEDLFLPGEVLVGPTVREVGGLAMSSRNEYLKPAERAAALAISRGLFRARDAFAEGERCAERLVDLARHEIDAEDLLRLEYVEARDLQTLDPWEGGERPALLAAAARIGQARLIDNVFLGMEIPSGEAISLRSIGRVRPRRPA